MFSSMKELWPKPAGRRMRRMRWRSPAPYSLLHLRLFWPVSVYNPSPNPRTHLQFFVLILSTTHSLPKMPNCLDLLPPFDPDSSLSYPCDHIVMTPVIASFFLPSPSIVLLLSLLLYIAGMNSMYRFLPSHIPRPVIPCPSAPLDSAAHGVSH